MWEATSNAAEMAQVISDMGIRQLPFALSRALNATTDDVLVAVNMEILRAFDRPNPYTQKAFMARKTARKDYQLAAVEQKPGAIGRDYLSTEVTGGPRQMTGQERALDARVAYAGVLRTVLPADGAKLDAYGNWSRGQRNQVFANIGAMSDPFMNTPSAGKKAAKLARAKTRYFIPRPARNGGGLYPGVYQRDGTGNLNIILAFTDAVPTYTPRFRFYEVAEAAARVAFPDHLRAKWAEAMSTAR